MAGYVFPKPLPPSTVPSGLRKTEHGNKTFALYHADSLALLLF
jgi:hypothetical protein